MKEKIKILQIVHLAVSAGVSIAYFLVEQPSMAHLKIPTIDASSAIYLIIPIVALLVSNLMFKSQLKQTDPELKPEENLPIYQTASIMRWVILEGAAFIILFLKPDFLLAGILLIVYLIALRPTEERVISDIKNRV
ncbi:MFS transporter [Flavobacterium sp. CLA17]|uniref:MFS transporter n=1 Tax=Flavobacterium sp. CLA17 TaxID=2724135 RepID=UPI001492B1CD|nr:MFS transporter [Flavobacterium sp. CLA17]QSB26583.1 MFS transporter [Flavobacterium sp. CLA17]